MAKLVWDTVGERTYEAGLDRGVLYLADGSGVAWNGLRTVNEELSANETTAFYFDGIKHIDAVSSGEYSATLTAFTYPDQFLDYAGYSQVETGLFAGNQGAKQFGLCYRIGVGNDTEGMEYGYKIHILYNLIAIPALVSYQSIAETVTPIEFSWTITSLPETAIGYRPTSHVIIDSTRMHPTALRFLEQLLYGDESDNASLPDLQSLITVITTGLPYDIVITDNGDGTWTATGPDANIIVTGTEFQIVGADATYFDANTYQISSTLF